MKTTPTVDDVNQLPKKKMSGCTLALIITGAITALIIGGCVLTGGLLVGAVATSVAEAEAETQAELESLKTADVSDIRSDGKLYELFKLDSDHTDIQREKAEADLIGQLIEWNLTVYEVNIDGDLKYRIQTSNKMEFSMNAVYRKKEVSTFIDLYPSNESERSAIEGLNTGDTIRVRGIIKGTFMRSIEIGPAILVDETASANKQTKKAKSSATNINVPQEITSAAKERCDKTYVTRGDSTFVLWDSYYDRQGLLREVKGVEFNQNWKEESTPVTKANGYQSVYSFNNNAKIDEKLFMMRTYKHGKWGKWTDHKNSLSGANLMIMAMKNSINVSFQAKVKSGQLEVTKARKNRTITRDHFKIIDSSFALKHSVTNKNKVSKPTSRKKARIEQEQINLKPKKDTKLYAKLIGKWEYHTSRRSVVYVFKKNGTFTNEYITYTGGRESSTLSGGRWSTSQGKLIMNGGDPMGVHWNDDSQFELMGEYLGGPYVKSN